MAPPEKAPPEKIGRWRKCRIVFRRFRLCLWVLVLLFLGALLYVNRVGLPGFAKRTLQNKLRARGVDLEFTRLRWRWTDGLVAENVRFGPTNTPSGPQLTAKEVRLRLKYGALFKFNIDGLLIRQGRIAWPVAGTNESPHELLVDNIQTELQLLPGDLWELDHFRAQLAGADIWLTGAITNASAVRDWPVFRGRRPAAPGLWESRLRRLALRLEQIHFAQKPVLKVDVHGDARDLQSFTASLDLRTPDAETPWGDVHSGALSILLHSATRDAPPRGELRLQAEQAQTRWASATNLMLRLKLVSDRADTNFIHCDLDLTVEGVGSEWGGATNAHFTAEWLHSITNAIPLSGSAEWLAAGAQSRWGGAQQLHGIATLFTPTNDLPVPDESWAWWTNLAPFGLSWECLVRGLQTPRLDAEEILCSGEWRAPKFAVDHLSAALYHGKLSAQADVNVASREVNFNASSDFDAQKVAPLLTEISRHWLEQYSWQTPPAVNAHGWLTLPAWTNLAHADWRGEVQPTLRIEGDFRAENGAFRGVPISYAMSTFSYSNLSWRLPDLVATRPDGRIDLAYEGNDRTHDFTFHIRSAMDPRALRPLFETNQQRAFDTVSFAQPPLIDAEVRGRWHSPELLAATGRVAVTNFTLRGEWMGNAQSAIEYSNLVLTCIEPRLYRGTQQMAASLVTVDFPAEKIYVTNGVSTADPASFTRAIGPKIGKAVEPYHFLQAPFVRAHGVIPMRHQTDADLHFEVEGGPFTWLRFRVPRIEGRVDWVGDRMTLRNVQADFYRGRALCNADFDFRAAQGAEFSFDFSGVDADLHSLMEDLTLKTNRLEGLLTGRVTVTQASSTNLMTWQGHGRLDLREGLIWAIPIFGVLSPALDGIIPGMGSSRVREGSANFIITNGVARSDDLELRASMMRLQYRGSVSLKGIVDAKVQAELLRDTWFVGRILSLALWPVTKVFEYKLTGTLKEPKSEPVFFVPRILLWPFHSSSSKSLISDQPDWSRTNAPPVNEK